MLLLVAICAIGVAAIKQRHESVEIPKVISKIKTLEVVGVTVKGEGEANAAVEIEIRNNSDKAVVALSVESGDEKDSSGVSTTGFKDGDEAPAVIIEPHGTIKMEMLVSNLLPGKPLKVSGVMYADDSTEGENLATEGLRDYKRRAKDRGAKKKGVSPNL
ncbi:MAG TPA: hypothetical protein VJT82_07015 [Pyrinomonadaceae bacterium]|nr:hypothetical protein [Pyrinomonadaceae bacterium]